MIWSKPVSGERLRKARVLKKLTQAEVAGRLGMSQAAYSNWERHGPRRYGLEYLERVARALETTSDYLQARETSSDLRAKLLAQQKGNVVAAKKLRHIAEQLVGVAELLEGEGYVQKVTAA